MGARPSFEDWVFEQLQETVNAISTRIGTSIGALFEWQRSMGLRDIEHKLNQQRLVDGILKGTVDVSRPAIALAANAQQTVGQYQDVARVADGVLASTEAAQVGKGIATLAAVPFFARPAMANPYIAFLRRHGDAPKPRPTGPNDFRTQSHHPLQRAWAEVNLKRHKYNYKEAPTVLLETRLNTPHTTITQLQDERAKLRVASGKGKWSSTINEELQFLVDDFKTVGFTDDVIARVLQAQYKMLRKLGVPFAPPSI